MRRTTPVPIYLTDRVMRAFWDANAYARQHDTNGTVILLGRRTRRRIIVLIAITEADTSRARRAKERQARTLGLVVVGQSRAVTENLLRTTTNAIKDEHATTLLTPPVGHVFLLRHRLGPHNTITAASFDGTAATQHDIHLVTRSR